MRYEHCCKCDAPTGKAGAGEDSLYTDHDGSFCEDCFPDKESSQIKEPEQEPYFKFRECEDSQAEQPAQPQQEPVARSKAYDMIDRFLRNNLNSDEDYAEYLAALEAVYTSPPTLSLAQRQSRSDVKPLTDDEIWREYRFLWPFHPDEERKLASDILLFAKAIEAKLWGKDNA